MVELTLSISLGHVQIQLITTIYEIVLTSQRAKFRAKNIIYENTEQEIKNNSLGTVVHCAAMMELSYLLFSFLPPQVQSIFHLFGPIWCPGSFLVCWVYIRQSEVCLSLILMCQTEMKIRLHPVQEG